MLTTIDWRSATVVVVSSASEVKGSRIPTTEEFKERKHICVPDKHECFPQSGCFSIHTLYLCESYLVPLNTSYHLHWE